MGIAIEKKAGYTVLAAVAPYLCRAVVLKDSFDNKLRRSAPQWHSSLARPSGQNKERDQLSYGVGDGAAIGVSVGSAGIGAIGVYVGATGIGAIGVSVARGGGGGGSDDSSQLIIGIAKAMIKTRRPKPTWRISVSFLTLYLCSSNLDPQ